MKRSGFSGGTAGSRSPLAVLGCSEVAGEMRATRPERGLMGRSTASARIGAPTCRSLKSRSETGRSADQLPAVSHLGEDRSRGDMPAFEVFEARREHPSGNRAPDVEPFPPRLFVGEPGERGVVLALGSKEAPGRRGLSSSAGRADQARLFRAEMRRVRLDGGAGQTKERLPPRQPARLHGREPRPRWRRPAPRSRPRCRAGESPRPRLCAGPTGRGRGGRTQGRPPGPCRGVVRP